MGTELRGEKTDTIASITNTITMHLTHNIFTIDIPISIITITMVTITIILPLNLVAEAKASMSEFQCARFPMNLVMILNMPN